MKKIARALGIFAAKAGIYGMIGGQTADIEAENEESGATEEQLLFIHEHKTAALIQSAMMVGAVLAEASEEEVERIEKCAYNIGLAFQIQDDILDVTGSLETLGKETGKCVFGRADSQVNNKRKIRRPLTADGKICRGA